ncbi:glycosyltransferase [Gillisia sp. Q332]|uniref:glycosyltransferase n=1 Tax=Gillisia xinjiangensis TaxID=3384765 RepID=UPI003918D510
MIKILYIIDSLVYGGAEKSLIEITTRFQNIEPVFIQVYRGDNQSEVLKSAGIRLIALNLSEKYGFNKAISKIIPLIDQIKPDIIHSTLYRSDVISRRLKDKVKIPIVNSFVSNSYNKDRYAKLSFDKKIKLKLIQYFDQLTAKKVDLFISNSHIIKKDNARVLKLPLDKIMVIPRGRFSENYIFNISEIAKYKKELGFENKKIILNVGRLIESKGQLDLIRAYSKIKDESSDSLLLIAGEGIFRENLEKEIIDLEMQQHVYLLGNRDDVPKLLAISDVFVFPTYLEGMPGSLIEAMLSKTAIICSDIRENRECMPPKFTNYFNPGDINKLQALMAKSIYNLESKENSIQETYEFAIQNYEIRIIVKKYETTYRYLLMENLSNK